MSDLLYLMSFKDSPPMVGDYSYAPEDFHLTVLSDFAVPTKRFHAFMKAVPQLIRWFSVIPLQYQGLELFGANKDIPVMTVSGGQQLTSLHESVAELVTSYGGNVRNPEFVNNGYSPHVSYLDDPDELWTLDSVSLIEHKGGFGVNVWNHGNWWFPTSPTTASAIGGAIAAGGVIRAVRSKKVRKRRPELSADY